MIPRHRARALLVASCILVTACVVRTRPAATELTSPVTVTSPVKAHLVDGSTVVFRSGVTYAADSLHGTGTQYDLRLAPSGTRASVPLDSVAGVEAISGGTDVAASVALSALGLGAGFLVGGAVAVAIFGSCPTVYASSSPDALMEAELFSHSIVPLAEARDVDRLGIPGERAIVTLDVRNEALETHFINHLELLEVSHGEDEWIVNDTEGLPLAASGWMTPQTVVDRDGRNVTARIDESDGVTYSTAAARLAAASTEDFEDWLDIDVPAPMGDSAVVVLRMRNSLLNTVLLYDFMLARSGLGAVDWLAGTLQRLGTAVETGRWYQSRMGMRVEVREHGAFRPVGRLSDTGPLAWKDVAIVVPVPRGEERLTVRLRFVTDQWRIDRIRVASAVRRPDLRVVPLARVVDRNGGELPEALGAGLEPDDRYIETRPGDIFQAVFEPGPPEGPRTFLLAAQGYYTEWLRPEWIRTAVDSRPFEPGDDVLLEAIDRWRSVKPDMETRFYRARIPTR